MTLIDELMCFLMFFIILEIMLLMFFYLLINDFTIYG